MMSNHSEPNLSLSIPYPSMIHQITCFHLMLQHENNSVQILQVSGVRLFLAMHRKYKNVRMRFSKTTKTLSILYTHQKTKHKKASTILGLATEKRDLRTYANSEDPDQPAHPLNLGGFFAVPLHNIWTLLKIKIYSEDFDPTCGCANWSGGFAIRICPEAFLSAGGQFKIHCGLHHENIPI